MTETLPGLNGRPAGRALTRPKLEEMKRLVAGTVSGDRAARGLLESHLTTGDDSIFSFAYLVGAQALPLFDKLPRTWNQIADTQSYPDFSGIERFALVPEVDGFARPVTEPGKPPQVPPVVPEGSPYPHFTFEGELYNAGGLRKRGGAFSLSWEKLISKLSVLLPQIPQLLAESFRDAEDWEVYSQLLAGATTANDLSAGTTVTGVSVPANAPLSRDALILAMQQLSQRTLDGRPIDLTGGFRLVVPVGGALAANFILNQTLTGIQTNPASGTPEYVYQVNGYNPLQGITVVESSYIPAGQWFLIPAPGSSVRPILELAKLVGHETPEFRIENATGNYFTGGAVSPYEGSFETDDIRLRGRYPLKGVFWTPDLLIWSNGTGS